MIWNKNHPEADSGDLRAYSWKQAAELAVIDPQHAAALLSSYESAPDLETAMRRGVDLESARAEALYGLRQPSFNEVIRWS